MQGIVGVAHEDVPALIQLTANVYRCHIRINASYAKGNVASIVDGDRDMVDRISCVAADVEQRVTSYLRKLNNNAKVTLQENRRA